MADDVRELVRPVQGTLEGVVQEPRINQIVETVAETVADQVLATAGAAEAFSLVARWALSELVGGSWLAMIVHNRSRRPSTLKDRIAGSVIPCTHPINSS